MGKDYVVAVLTKIDNEEYTPVQEVATRIRAQLLRDKKFDFIAKELSGASLDEQAASLGTEVADFEKVGFNSYYIDGVGMEPRLIGAIAACGQPGCVSAPVKGLTGVYVFQVDEVQHGDAQTPEAEKVRAQAMAESMAQQFVLPVIQDMAQIKDLRGKYF